MEQDLKKRSEDFIKMYNDGYTLQQIANKYNISRQRVHQIFIKLNLPRRRTKGSKVYIDITKCNELPNHIQALVNGLNKSIDYYYHELRRQKMKNLQMKKYYQAKLLKELMEV